MYLRCDMPRTLLSVFFVLYLPDIVTHFHFRVHSSKVSHKTSNSLRYSQL